MTEPQRRIGMLILHGLAIGVLIVIIVIEVLNLK